MVSVEEIKELVAGHDVFALAKDVTYLIAYDMNSIPQQTLREVLQFLDPKIRTAFVGVDGKDALKIFKLEEK